MNIRQSHNNCYEYSVFHRDEYIGFVFAPSSRKWASVCTADREIVAFTCGADAVQHGAELLTNA